MSDETVPQPKIKISWFFWTLLALLLFVVIGVYSSRMAQNATDYDAKRAMARYANLDKLRDEETKTLTTADWIDQDKKVIRIPIDEAMLKEIDTLKSKPLAEGGVIPGTMPPAPAAAAPAASTNAAPAAAMPPSSTTNAAPAAAMPPGSSTNAAPATPAKPASTPAAKPVVKVAPKPTTQTY